MHELAVCQALIRQVETVVARHRARGADRVVVSVGPLSGVEPALLASAFTIAREGTSAAGAELEIESAGIQVTCKTCGARSAAQPNRLLCDECGDWRVQVTQGDELMLLRVGLVSDARQSAPGKREKSEDPAHV
jgi:hydrogenase nickel incorporation protein HypA/HybF